MKLKSILEKVKEEQKRIALIEQRAQLMQSRAQQFLMGDPDEQSSMMAEAMNQLQAQEQEFANQEAMLDEQVEVPVESEEV